MEVNHVTRLFQARRAPHDGRMPAPLIVLFTDFGVTGPYVGEMKARLALGAPGVPVIDLISDAPRFNPKAAAYLLAALAPGFPVDTVLLAVVDPGVGTAERLPAAVLADGRWYVGPGNGLFDVVARRADGPPPRAGSPHARGRLACEVGSRTHSTHAGARRLSVR